MSLSTEKLFFLDNINKSWVKNMGEKFDFKKIKSKLKRNLDSSRYKHTKNVAEVARCLAMRYGLELDVAYVAGLLHDCAKCFSDTKKFSLCKSYGIELSKEEHANPALIHAKLGAAVAKKEYNINDTDILNSICYHTTGRENMSILEKIIYISDYIEPGRQELPRIAEIRRAAFIDIDSAMAMVTEDSLNYLQKKGGVIDSNTRKAYEFYSNSNKEK